jgi:hypothetical protein
MSADYAALEARLAGLEQQMRRILPAKIDAVAYGLSLVHEDTRAMRGQLGRHGEQLDRQAGTLDRHGEQLDGISRRLDGQDRQLAVIGDTLTAHGEQLIGYGGGPPAWARHSPSTARRLSSSA